MLTRELRLAFKTQKITIKRFKNSKTLIGETLKAFLQFLKLLRHAL